MRTRDPKLRRLAGVPIFRGLSDRALALVAACADEFERPAGVDLIREGTPAWETFVVLDGAVAVCRGGSQVAVVGPGGVIGEMAVVAGTRRNAGVVTLTTTRLVAFAAHDLHRAMDASPEVADRIRACVRQRSAPIPA